MRRPWPALGRSAIKKPYQSKVEKSRGGHGKLKYMLLTTVYVNHITCISSLLYEQVTSKQHEPQLFLEANSLLSFQEIFTLYGT